MADPNFATMTEDADDLPRTFKREKEAREREARERAARERAAAPTLSTHPDPYVAPAPSPKIYAEPAHGSGGLKPSISGEPVPAIVKRIDVPFAHLVTFFLKAVIAAIPALILLMMLLWGVGAVLEALFPELVKMKILIGIGG